MNPRVSNFFSTRSSSTENRRASDLAAICIASVLLIASDSTGNQQSVDWQPVTSAGPPSRNAHAMVYDSERGRTILFGGDEGNGTLFSDTWEWNGQTWTQRSATGPAGRNMHAMAFDLQRNKTVLFAGQSANGKLTDTWEFTGNLGTWSLRATNGPSARAYHAMAYDEARHQTVLFGGSDSPGGINYNGETWLWDGTSWSLASATGPSPRLLHAMAYDTARQRVVLFGGSDASGKLADTWEWNGQSWTHRSNCPERESLHGFRRCELTNRAFRRSRDTVLWRHLGLGWYKLVKLRLCRSLEPRPHYNGLGCVGGPTHTIRWVL